MSMSLRMTAQVEQKLELRLQCSCIVCQQSLGTRTNDEMTVDELVYATTAPENKGFFCPACHQAVGSGRLSVCDTEYKRRLANYNSGRSRWLRAHNKPRSK